MAIRTSISFTTSNIQEGVRKVSSEHYRGNTSAYVESLIIEDLINRGHSRQDLLNDTPTEKEPAI